jgi:hypothetical protein
VLVRRVAARWRVSGGAPNTIEKLRSGFSDLNSGGEEGFSAGAERIVSAALGARTERIDAPDSGLATGVADSE